jgi:hypothetical protein
MEEVACRRCGKVKPRTAEFWERHHFCKDGFRKTCRECMRPIRAASSTRHRANAEQKRKKERDPVKRAKLWADWCARNREHVREQRRRYRQSEKGRAQSRAYEERRKEELRPRRNLLAQARNYGLSVDALQAMLRAQEGKCAICGKEAVKLHVDHDHGTGKVRALLCSNCNGGLGGFRDNIDFLDAAKAYLTFHSPKGDQLCLAIKHHKKAKP